MTSRRPWFNFYLIAGMAMWLGGCASTKDPNDKLSTQMRIHLEAQPSQMIPPQTIAVYRADPQPVKIESLCLLTEEHVVNARVVDQAGAYALQLQFNEWAIPLLEHNSSSYQGRRLAIQAQWGPKQEFTRWLGAPRMTQRIVNGTFTFTPDATREECFQIVAGLNNNARKVKKQLQW
ncbi:MAG: hypothetical protein MUE94_00885 [Verrucomicrobia bacterium]|jgi:hypothetical protein|nr:hypothetical protein [Verrucomicrobiota bacterium]